MGQTRNPVQCNCSRPGTDGRRILTADAGEGAGGDGQEAQSAGPLWHASGAGRPGRVSDERPVRLRERRADRDGWRRAAARCKRIPPPGRSADGRTMTDYEAEKEGLTARTIGGAMTLMEVNLSL